MIYKWDLDKTYIKTDFETLKGLIKTVLQKPEEKENVPGASALIKEIEKDKNNSVYFISGSPEQMRHVLEVKLKIDGIKWDNFVLKPNLRNLLHAKFRALKDQIGYKLPVLLEQRRITPVEVDEVLLGDDAETDAFVYSMYADIIARRVSKDMVEHVLHEANIYEHIKNNILKLYEEVKTADPVKSIFIHLEKRTPPYRFNHYGNRVIPIYNYFQAAIVLYKGMYIDYDAVVNVGMNLVNNFNYSVDMLVNSLQDLLRRKTIIKKDIDRFKKEIKEDKKIWLKTPVSEILFSRFNESAEHLDYLSIDKKTEFIPENINYIDLYREKNTKTEKKRRSFFEQYFE
ncbi:MAG: hypothetical protein M1381_07505 [Deltaproteobacteria bacterium]|nr:hypothetical protein [Deltaproteobacteria bacterium]MCL5792586.1 hypothetical protein [Deltaproteobacteria bacterium]